MPYPTKCTNEIGNRHGLLTVVARHPYNTVDGRAMWACECYCGGGRITQGKLLRNGCSISCGCLKRGTHRSKFSKEGLCLPIIE